MGTFVFLSVWGDSQMNAKQAWYLCKIPWKMLLIVVFCNLLDTIGAEIFKFKSV